MPIKVRCQCGQSFVARDDLAGKTVKCPKCEKPLQVQAGAPSAGARPSAPPSAASARPAAAGYVRPAAGGAAGPSGPLGGDGAGLADLLEEAGMATKPQHAGPSCPKCSAPLPPNAVLCVSCGLDLKSGRQKETFAVKDNDDFEFAHLSHAERMVAKAERDLAMNPEAADDADFGEADKPTTWLLALALPLLAIVTTIATVLWGSSIGTSLLLILAAIFAGQFLLVLPLSLVLIGAIMMFSGWLGLTFRTLEINTFLGLICMGSAVLLLVVVGIFIPPILGILYWKKCKTMTIVYIVGFVLALLAVPLGIVVGATTVLLQGGQAGV